MPDLSPLTSEQLRSMMKEFRDQAAQTERAIRNAQEELDKRDQKECEKFVGRYFKTNDKYFKVIGVPQFILTMARTHYEANQLPAIIVEVEGTSFDDIYEDTIYRASIDAAYRDGFHRLFPEEIAEEITPAEFDEFLNEKVRQATARTAATERFANR